MQDENIFKISKMANTEITELPMLNILICYLLYKIDKPVGTENLYDILISTECVNFFLYNDSIDYLLKNGHLKIEEDNGKKNYILLPKGKACARELKTYAPKAYRDRLVLSALRYFTRLKYEQEIKLDFEPLENGCYVCVRCLDSHSDLMDLKLFAPDMTQAKLIGERIMLNPAGFYSKVVELALSNKEDIYDLSDN